MTSKLNIDISLAVSLNIIRPLFVDKTIATSYLSSNRHSTLLQQQPIDIFSHSQRSQQKQHEQRIHSISNESMKRHMRRSTSFFQHLSSKLDDYQSEPYSFNEHPENFIRILLTKLLGCIKSKLPEGSKREFVECIFTYNDS